ncbi:TetR/AcrR family transcriptional regulator [Sphingomonas sanxanigenens]|uniref:HTH tetR-type domain-containing protein n=1 Tax=Sphingomonas sanxanigenens DSM 19645 = NX02 TaxID=1123269 RepID=W0A5V7_9SPHN|nr:TetR/AcrR family transcriptional regulator [Sphingomonas sanxanigenens]AHE51862.1 hypothetical protein NX02_00470 [Sphingomonas sanxanigenens DSM 19645 = NX02]
MTSAPKAAKAPDRETTERIVDAARAVIAERGLEGAGLRVVAERAGVSVGTINYRIGDRAALIEAVADRETALLEGARERWRARVGTADVLAAGLLPDLAAAWLDEGAGERRVSAIVTAELALAARREPEALPGVARLLAASEDIWRDVLAGSPGAGRLAAIVADYCFDEQPFSILLAAETDYRLLRASTIRALLAPHWPRVSPAASRWHMQVVERLAVPSAAALDDGAPPQGLKAVIADRIGELLQAHGFATVSHRRVAQAVAAPVSTIAHHFPAQRDLVLGGVEAMYRSMRAALRRTDDASAGGFGVILLTHEAALTALRDPALIPFAIDMRRRRAENVHMMVAKALGIEAAAARDITQAVIMALIGQHIRLGARGEGVSLVRFAAELRDTVRSSEG